MSYHKFVYSNIYIPKDIIYIKSPTLWQHFCVGLGAEIIGDKKVF